MTDQEIVDKVFDHFILQMTPPAVDPKGPGCYYHHEEYGCCVVGIFIDSKTGDDWDNDDLGSIDEIRDLHTEEYHQYFTDENLPLLIELQHWHDDDLRRLFQNEDEDLSDDRESRRATLAHRLSDFDHITVPSLDDHG